MATDPDTADERTVAMPLPADLVAAIDAEASRRMVGRKLLLPYLLRLGLDHLPPWPSEGGT